MKMKMMIKAMMIEMMKNMLVRMLLRTKNETNNMIVFVRIVGMKPRLAFSRIYKILVYIVSIRVQRIVLRFEMKKMKTEKLF
jgi:hypothetical protein